VLGQQDSVTADEVSSKEEVSLGQQEFSKTALVWKKIATDSSFNSFFFLLALF